MGKMKYKKDDEVILTKDINIMRKIYLGTSFLGIKIKIFKISEDKYWFKYNNDKCYIKEEQIEGYVFTTWKKKYDKI